MIVEPPRMLTDEERTLLTWLVTKVDQYRSTYESQVDTARVVGHCECGCGSIHFADGLPTEDAPAMEIIADHPSRIPGSRVVDVILWARSGSLSYLEIVIYDGLGPCPTPHPSWFE